MSITPADLAVGQVWRSREVNDLSKIVRIADGVVFYVVDGCEHEWSAARFADWANECAELDASTVPHPAALADLYEALRGMLDSYIQLKQISLYIARSDAPNWIGRDMTPEGDVHVIAARAALAKAGAK